MIDTGAKEFRAYSQRPEKALMGLRAVVFYDERENSGVDDSDLSRLVRFLRENLVKVDLIPLPRPPYDDYLTRSMEESGEEVAIILLPAEISDADRHFITDGVTENKNYAAFYLVPPSFSSLASVYPWTFIYEPPLREDSPAAKALLAAIQEYLGKQTSDLGKADSDADKTSSKSVQDNTYVHNYVLADQPTSNDALGYAFYAQALADFIRDRRTGVPLTVSIEGEWGSGKSSFLLQVEKLIRARSGDFGNSVNDIPTVWFNPWKHDTGEALWAAFAVSFERQMMARVRSKRDWVKRRWRLTWLRADLRRSWPRVIRGSLPLMGWVVAVPIVIFLMFHIRDFRNWEWAKAESAAKQSLIYGVVAALFALGKKVKDFLGNPIREDLRTVFKNPDYAQKVASIERFHEDFRRLVWAYADDSSRKETNRIVVFIDDLDRCEVPKAAELLQSLQLLMSAQESLNSAQARPLNLVFVLGIDRETVAAGIAAKYEKLWPYLTATDGNLSIENQPALQRALNFGFEYLEKFIDVTLRLPKSDERSMQSYVNHLCQFTPERPTSDPTRAQSEHIGSVDEQLANEIHRAERRDFVTKSAKVEKMLQETALVNECARMAAPLLHFNPRRVKQFINTFRLRARLSPIGETVIPRSDESSQLKMGLHLPQIAKLVAIELAYPLILRDWIRNPRLFTLLTVYYRSKSSKLVPANISPIWKEDAEIEKLFLYNLDQELPDGGFTTDHSDWSLSRVDQQRYFAIAPPPTEAASHSAAA